MLNGFARFFLCVLIILVYGGFMVFCVHTGHWDDVWSLPGFLVTGGVMSLLGVLATGKDVNFL